MLLAQPLWALAISRFSSDNESWDYWHKAKKRSKLAEKEITITADTRSNWHIKDPPQEQDLLDAWRGRVERRIGLFDTQFHASRTLCRSLGADNMLKRQTA